MDEARIKNKIKDIPAKPAEENLLLVCIYPLPLLPFTFHIKNVNKLNPAQTFKTFHSRIRGL